MVVRNRKPTRIFATILHRAGGEIIIIFGHAKYLAAKALIPNQYIRRGWLEFVINVAATM